MGMRLTREIRQFRRVAADDSRLHVRGGLAVERTATALRIFRRIDDPHGLSSDAPGATIEFVTDATELAVHVRFTGVHIHPARSRTFALVIGGTHVLTRSPAKRWRNAVLRWRIGPGGPKTPRHVSLFLPYGDSVELAGFELPVRALLRAPRPASPKPAWHAFGDSITQGYFASSAYHSYPVHVARLRGWEAYNWGIGGRCFEPHDAECLGTSRPAIVTVLLGFNDFYQQRRLVDVGQAVSAYLAALRSQCGLGVPICVVTPLWTAHEPPVGGHSLASYRAAISRAVTAASDRCLTIVDGLALLPGGRRYFPDGIHPNDAGFARLARALAAVLPTPAADSR